jgi:hypothetical protein
MTPQQRRKRLREEIVTAVMRRDWAIAEAERTGTTPALTRFIEESKSECSVLNAKLKKLIQPRAKRKSKLGSSR